MPKNSKLVLAIGIAALLSGCANLPKANTVDLPNDCERVLVDNPDPPKPSVKSDPRVDFYRMREAKHVSDDTIKEGRLCVVNERKLYERAK